MAPRTLMFSSEEKPSSWLSSSSIVRCTSRSPDTCTGTEQRLITGMLWDCQTMLLACEAGPPLPLLPISGMGLLQVMQPAGTPATLNLHGKG